MRHRHRNFRAAEVILLRYVRNAWAHKILFCVPPGQVRRLTGGIVYRADEKRHAIPPIIVSFTYVLENFMFRARNIELLSLWLPSNPLNVQARQFSTRQRWIGVNILQAFSIKAAQYTVNLNLHGGTPYSHSSTTEHCIIPFETLTGPR